MAKAKKTSGARNSSIVKTVDLGIHLTTNISDDGWQTIDPLHIACWIDAKSSLAFQTCELKSTRFDLSVDWSPVIRRLAKVHGVKKRLDKAIGTPEAARVVEQFPRSPVRVKFECASTGKMPEGLFVIDTLIESFLFDFFLIMNIASPASCNFYKTKIVPAGRFFEHGVDLSNHFFETSVLNSQSGNWPRTEFLPLSLTRDWYFSVRSRLRMLPQSRLEKVLFAILHICHIDAISPVTLIWIFYALETLFDTKAGENFRSLMSRIQLLLSPDPAEFKKLKKKMRDLYDLRSAFVHGGLDVIHPMHNESLDASIDGMTFRLLDATNYGFQIILSSLQVFSPNNYKEGLDESGFQRDPRRWHRPSR
jgi:hypothetical protein